MKTFLRWTALACAGLSCATAIAVEPRAISGAYYNPAQSGHGFSVEALDNDRAIAYWYVYDRDGNPVHLYIEGALTRIDNSQELLLTGRAYLPSGMRFGAFDPRDLRVREWGDVQLRLSCDGGFAHFDANGPVGVGFEQGGTPIGSTALSRLAAIKGVDRVEDCATGSGYHNAPVAIGGTYTRQVTGGAIQSDALVGAFDTEGRLWLAGASSGAPVITLAARFRDLIVTTEEFAEGQARINNIGLDALPRSAAITTGADLHHDGRALNFVGIDSPVHGAGVSPDLVRSITANPDAGDTAALHRPLTVAALAGRRFKSNATQGPAPTISFDAQGGLCLHGIRAQPPNCDLVGKLQPASGEWSFFDFELRYAQASDHAPLKGRGWVLFNPNGTPRRVVLVGAQGGQALGFVGDALTP